jgi:outer membrane lipopolysaccharide assembly protein LptE/RlpB
VKTRTLLLKGAAGWLGAVLVLSGCGYTNKVVLPNHIRTIYVDTVKNEIPVQSVYAYQAGLEIDITNAIVHRLNIDGNLKVTDRAGADAILECSLIEYSQGGVRFTRLERVGEYRLYVTIRMRLTDAKTGTVIWEEDQMTGDSEYEVDEKGVPEIARDEASKRAIERLARNVVDRIVEDW